MHEGIRSTTPKALERNRSHLVEASVLIAALAAFDHNPAQALELAPQTSWNNAITGNIRESVRKDTNESRFTYVQYSKTEGEWLQINSGSGGRAEFNVSQYARALLNNPKYGDTKKICTGHSHPNEIFRASTPNSDAYKRFATPPSSIPGDLQAAKIVEHELGLFRIPKGKLVNFVADIYGIWYFRTAQQSDYRNADERKTAGHINTTEAREKHNKTYQAFVIKSLTPNIDLRGTTEYKNLLDSYRINRGGMVRFVPYEEVPSEPACAGVDFKG
ncbi:hypothetical protein A3F27_02405 [Candidatus Kaiserbacteria bacterium RIFCSPHIGHO2_12_FULL_53_13]|uniref:Uncharacterized protein n=1 Tax=Candidatus Kaiserbacteria bacterium RIFCSPHIGHO2_12_FULL_53_13 TaxID=1798502 RepID=A0A1F6EC74_9BACT|nr:MAG: hypothetical protein A3F27_02405 [Candidatus Kaiserbacteria bacterium RIFCSPHIGHO2_12_FULL_53_13]OGG74626.1 MAG: hypothetical protein A3A37_01870 [Candidatus Kaiserbacteria bacterium RIFCSPLOWO2_01_FULL_52_36]